MKDYQPIPDVEAGIIKSVETTSNGSTKQETGVRNLTPQEKYPKVNKDEAQLLSLIDGAIDNPIPALDPPQLKISLLEVADSFDWAMWIKDILLAMKVPILAGIAALGGAIINATLNSPTSHKLFPYFSAIVIFLSTIPPIHERFIDTFELMSFQINSTASLVFMKVDDVANQGSKYLNDISEATTKVLTSILYKIDKAKKNIRLIRRVDPNAPDIPDKLIIENIENELKEATEKMKEITVGLSQYKGEGGVNAFEHKLLIYKGVKSREKLHQSIIAPFQCLFLLIQLVCAYYVTTPPSKYSEIAWAQVFTPFVVAIVHINVCFVVTEKSLLQSSVNTKITGLNQEIQQTWNKKFGPVWKDVFVKRLPDFKQSVLVLLEKKKKMEPGLMELPSSTQDLGPLLRDFGI